MSTLQTSIRPSIIVFSLLTWISAVSCIAPISASAQTDELSRLNQQFVKLRDAGRYAEALPIAQRALAIYEKTVGPQHPYVATTLSSLASVYRALHRYAEAEPLYDRSGASASTI